MPLISKAVRQSYQQAVCDMHLQVQTHVCLAPGRTLHVLPLPVSHKLLSCLATMQGVFVRASVPAMQALPPAPHTPVLRSHGPTPAVTAAPPGAPALLPPTMPQKYFSPLNTNKSIGASAAHVHAQLSEFRSSMHFSDSGGDTQAPTASDQQAMRDTNDAQVRQQPELELSGPMQQSHCMQGMGTV